MAIGSVYEWEPCDSDFPGDRVHLSRVELPPLPRDAGRSGALRGRYVGAIGHVTPPAMAILYLAKRCGWFDETELPPTMAARRREMEATPANSYED